MMTMMPPQYNPYVMQQKLPSQNLHYNKTGFDSGINLTDASDQSILAFLEQYLGLENLNKDMYLRNRIDEHGFIDCDEIANHNKFKRLGITLDKLVEVLNENVEHPLIEANITVNEKVVVRNREWDQIKEKLLSKEQIFQQKKIQQSKLNMNNQMNYNPYMTHPGMNMNYVTLQNNYFFTGMPQEGMGYNNMYVQNPYSGLMQQSTFSNQNIPNEEGSNEN